MIQLSADTSHINNGFGDNNLGVMMGMPGVQYSGSYGSSLFVKGSSNAPPVDNYTDVSFSVAYTILNYS